MEAAMCGMVWLPQALGGDISGTPVSALEHAQVGPCTAQQASRHDFLSLVADQSHD